MFSLVTENPKNAPQFGDLRVVYIHQVGQVVPVTCPASDLIDAYTKVQLIANLMLSLQQTRAIPDYANVIFLEVYEMDNNQPEGGEWVEWENTDEGAWHESLEDLVEKYSHNGWMLASDRPFTPEIGKRYTLIDKDLQVTIFDNLNGDRSYNNEAFDPEKIIAWRIFHSPDNGIDELTLIEVQ